MYHNIACTVNDVMRAQGFRCPRVHVRFVNLKGATSILIGCISPFPAHQIKRHLFWSRALSEKLSFKRVPPKYIPIVGHPSVNDHNIQHTTFGNSGWATSPSADASSTNSCSPECFVSRFKLPLAMRSTSYAQNNPTFSRLKQCILPFGRLKSTEIINVSAIAHVGADLLCLTEALILSQPIERIKVSVLCISGRGGYPKIGKCAPSIHFVTRGIFHACGGDKKGLFLGT